MSRVAALRLPHSRPAAPPAHAPAWSQEGRDWPQRDASRFQEAGGVVWHLQQYGAGEDLLLLHGTGAATHSWRDLGPLLAQRWRVTAVDLPGHGFSSAPSSSAGYTPGGMARSLAALLHATGVGPQVIVGHSAGAALGAALALDGHAVPRRLIALNGALASRHAFSAALFPAMARLASQPALAQVFAARADAAHVERVIAGTGSTLDAWGLELYGRLFARPAHVSAAFAMMANWSRDGTLARLHRLPCPLALATALDDRAIPPADAEAAAQRVRGAKLVRLAQGGHLVHESDPDAIARLILDLCDEDSAA